MAAELKELSSRLINNNYTTAGAILQGIADVLRQANLIPDQLPVSSSQNSLEAMCPDVGSTARQLRQKNGLSIRKLARQAQMSPMHLGRIERGEASPSIRTLHGLAQALDVPISRFFE